MYKWLYISNLSEEKSYTIAVLHFQIAELHKMKSRQFYMMKIDILVLTLKQGIAGIIFTQ